MKKEEIMDRLNSDQPKFGLDTNVIIAYLNLNNEFHLEATTAIDALIANKILVLIPHIVLGELIAHRNLLIKGKNYSIRKILQKAQQAC
ncbi:MAG: PIN domain-containing protein [Candidatus Komeilibacteria bacterium]|nr:PIN domain-containing protein [Candidatus Komeilibacteria bacterium]